MGNRRIIANSDSWYQGYDVALAKELGDINAAIFYQYLNYWCKKAKKEHPEGDGYCWRTIEEISEDTAMTKFQIRRATEVLCNNQLLDCKRTYIPGTQKSCNHYKTLSSGCQVDNFDKVKKLNFLESKETELSYIYNTIPNTETITKENSSSTSSLEASETLGEDESAETTKHAEQDNQRGVPPQPEEKLNNEAYATKVYRKVEQRLSKAGAKARSVGNKDRLLYFTDQLRRWRQRNNKKVILRRIQWLLDNGVYTQLQIENVLVDTVNGFYERKETNVAGDEVEVQVPNDLVRVLTQPDTDQMLWQLDKNFKMTDDVIDELLGGTNETGTQTTD